ncbi:MAG: hypothetical protein AAGC60_04695 [Acidobacteriota bacterium]
MLGEVEKVAIGGEDRQIEALGNGTDEEVGVGTLAPFLPAPVEDLRGAFEVAAHKLDIGESLEDFAESAGSRRRPATSLA